MNSSCTPLEHRARVRGRAGAVFKSCSHRLPAWAPPIRHRVLGAVMSEHTPSDTTPPSAGSDTAPRGEHRRAQRFRELASPLDELDFAFRALTTGPAPLALAG